MVQNSIFASFFNTDFMDFNNLGLEDRFQNIEDEKMNGHDQDDELEAIIENQEESE